MSSSTEDDDSGFEPEKCFLYVDEAGTPDIFDSKGRVNIGKEGCSNYFILGMLEVDDPESLATAFTTLRLRLLADPYFNTAESFKPERKKTALIFHAKDDLPEVRVKVFDLLRSFASEIHFRAVVCDKESIRKREVANREANPGYRFQPDNLYDELCRALLAKFSRMADRFLLRIAKRGNKERNKAISTALEHAEADFEQKFGVSRGGVDAWEIKITDPHQVICLQAVDYFLWALQRFYEPRIHQTTGEITREIRYLDAMWPQVSQIHDMHFGAEHGTFFTRENRLTIDSRFGTNPRKRKKPQV